MALFVPNYTEATIACARFVLYFVKQRDQFVSICNEARPRPPAERPAVRRRFTL